MSANLIPIVELGQQPSADYVNRQRDTARNLTPRSSGGAGLMVRHYAGGAITVPLRREQPVPVLSGGALAPFDIFVETVAGTPYATFWPGTVNSLLPSNGMAGLASGVAVVASGVRYLVLTCTAASGAITGAVFSAETSPPAAITPLAGSPPVSFKILIGVTIDGEAVKVWRDGNIQALPVEAFRTQKTVPVAGQLPYDVYYTWALSLL